MPWHGINRETQPRLTASPVTIMHNLNRNFTTGSAFLLQLPLVFNQTTFSIRNALMLMLPQYQCPFSSTYPQSQPQAMQQGGHDQNCSEAPRWGTKGQGLQARLNDS
jgi:hypothetical protein